MKGLVGRCTFAVYIGFYCDKLQQVVSRPYSTILHVKQIYSLKYWITFRMAPPLFTHFNKKGYLIGGKLDTMLFHIE